MADHLRTLKGFIALFFKICNIHANSSLCALAIAGYKEERAPKVSIGRGDSLYIYHGQLRGNDLEPESQKLPFPSSPKGHKVSATFPCASRWDFSVVFQEE